MTVLYHLGFQIIHEYFLLVYQNPKNCLNTLHIANGNMVCQVEPKQIVIYFSNYAQNNINHMFPNGNLKNYIQSSFSIFGSLHSGVFNISKISS